jgi:hypothetical protein
VAIAFTGARESYLRLSAVNPFTSESNFSADSTGIMLIKRA